MTETKNKSALPGECNQETKLASKWNKFDEAVNETRAALADLPLEELQNVIGKALKSIRAVRTSKKANQRETATSPE